MKSILLVIICFGIILVSCGCSKSDQIADGIWLIDDLSISNVINLRTSGHELAQQFKYSDDLVKFEVVQVNYVEYLWDDKDLDLFKNRYGSIYKVKVIKSLINSGLMENTEVLIFSDHSPQKYDYGCVNLQQGNTYIASLVKVKTGVLSESLTNYVDYYFKQQEFNVFPCKSNNQYYIQKQYSDLFDMLKYDLVSGQAYETEPDNYHNYEILPQDEQKWTVIESNNFENALRTIWFEIN